MGGAISRLSLCDLYEVQDSLPANGFQVGQSVLCNNAERGRRSHLVPGTLVRRGILQNDRKAWLVSLRGQMGTWHPFEHVHPLTVKMW